MSLRSLTINSGYITGYDGKPVPINQRFFEGGDSSAASSWPASARATSTRR